MSDAPCCHDMLACVSTTPETDSLGSGALSRPFLRWPRMIFRPGPFLCLTAMTPVDARTHEEMQCPDP
jgi:hypothetical protein